jgi:centromere protein I
VPIAAAKLPAKQRGVSVKPTIERLAARFYERGVLPDELNRLIELITTPNHLDQASLGTIVRNLYPSGKVADLAVLKIVGCLGHGQLKPSLNVQSLLLKWLAMTYHILENAAVLSQAYSVLFNHLDTAALRYGTVLLLPLSSVALALYCLCPVLLYSLLRHLLRDPILP